MAVGRATHQRARDLLPPAIRVHPELRAERRIQRRCGRPARIENECVLRVPQAGKVVGTPGSEQPTHSRQQQKVMFSLHIDTARTWRGGQNQVLTTIMGLRALGHRTLLVAHSEGELRQRAAEGLDLVPLAPKTEMDLTAAWRLSRILKQLKPDVIHAHDPHGVAMAALALSMSTQVSK